MLIWLIAGLLSWTGAASFAELGSIVPQNGGTQEYLRYCYNDICGFLAAWTWVLVMKPCSVAIISLTFSEYLCRAFAVEEDPSVWILKGFALLAVILITYINCLGTRVGAGTANVFLILKFLGLGSVIATGLVLGAMHLQPTVDIQGVVGSGENQIDSGLWANLGACTDATLSALWAYSGWEVVSIFLTPKHCTWAPYLSQLIRTSSG
jgi:amino acid transporter